MQCESCGTVLPLGAHFCPNCASRVTSPEGPEFQDPLRQSLETALGFLYRIERRLGKGGMGIVYLAHELALDRPVAIKVLSPDCGAGGELRERFRREARTAARLTHPNIVPLYTFGEVAGLTYFVMGYVKGESLAARLNRLGHLEPAEVQAILRDITDALVYAHRQGVIHRDVKPDNVLIEEDSGRPMLADFGIAKATDSGTTLTSTGYIVGTPHYMSPEQCLGRKDVDGRTDLYSLGVMGYQMLSGRLPFDGETPGEVLRQQLTQEPHPLAPMAGNAPDLLVAAIERCLAKDPAARWNDAASLKQALAAEATPQEEPDEYRLLRAPIQLGVITTLIQIDVSLLRALNRQGSDLSPDLFITIMQSLLALQLLCLFLAGTAAFGIHRRYRVNWRRIIQGAFVQPAWWPFWFPRRLRRSGDVWHLWPRQLRRFWHSAAVMFAAIFFLGWSMHLHLFASHGERLMNAAKLCVLIASAWAFAEGFVASRFLRQHLGADVARRGDEQKALGQPASSVRFWQRPPFNSLLQPEETRSSNSTPNTPDGEAVEITRLVGNLPTDLRQLGEAAKSAAWNLRASIRALEHEITDMERDADPSEAKRLREKIDALGPTSPDEPVERMHLRDLLAQQSNLILEIEQRLGLANRERNSRIELLRRLRLEVANVRAEAARAAVVSGKTRERLQELCSEIAKRAKPISVPPTSERTATFAGMETGDTKKT